MSARPAALSIICLIGILALALQAGADPIPAPEASATEPFEFWAFIFFLNFALNLFWFSLLMLILLSWKGNAVADIRPGRFKFHARTLATVAILTLLGFVIDRTFLYENIGGWLYPVRDALKSALAAILVGLSVLFLPKLLMRVRLRYGLLLAGGMMAMNLFWWGLLDHPALEQLWCMPAIFAVLAPLVFLELDRWYRNIYMKTQTRVLEAAANSK
jgi:hypothetical protein